MPGFLDTNVAVRYLAGSPEEAATKATELIHGADSLYITHVILAETAYVLSSFYRIPRSTVVDALVSLISRENIQIWDGTISGAVDALQLCRNSNRVSFADALLWSAARASDAPVVYTFDQSFPVYGITVARPGA